MQIETKNSTTTVVSQSQVDREVTGFSFTPTAVLSATVEAYTTVEYSAVRNGLFKTNQDSANANPKPAYATVGVNKVTVRIITIGAANTTYNVKLTVTAART